MMTKIPWTERTCNPIVGCSKVSAGCKNCYAERMAVRLAAMGMKDYEWVTLSKGGWSGNTTFVESALQKPLNRKKPTMYFVCSMGDLFHESVPFKWIDRVFEVMALCGRRWRYGKHDGDEGTEIFPHTFQILTKRPERMAAYFEQARERWDTWAGEYLAGTVSDYVYANGWPLPNVWLGVTAENQAMADERIPVLLSIPAAVRFVSVEPMLEPVKLWNRGTSGGMHNLGPVCTGRGLDWVIVGCESGPKRRPCKLEWVESVVDQCAAASVPVFVKQLDIDGKLVKAGKAGEYPTEWPEHLRKQEFPK